MSVCERVLRAAPASQEGLDPEVVPSSSHHPTPSSILGSQVKP